MKEFENLEAAVRRHPAVKRLGPLSERNEVILQITLAAAQKAFSRYERKLAMRAGQANSLRSQIDSEQELSKLRQEIVRLRGQVQITGLQGRLGMTLALAARGGRVGLEAMFTPLLELPQLLLTGKSAHPLDGTETALPRPVLPAPAAPGELDEEEKKKLAEHDRLVDDIGGGGWLSVLLSMVTRGFRNLTPASIAVIYLLSVGVAIAFGEHSKTSLRGEVDMFREKAEKYGALQTELKDTQSKLKEQEKTIADQKTAFDDQKVTISTHLSRIAESEGETKAEQAKLLEEKNLHQADLNKKREQLDQETRTLLTQSQDTQKALQTKADAATEKVFGLTNQITALTGDLKAANIEKEGALAAAKDTAAVAEQYKAEKLKLQPLVDSTLPQLVFCLNHLIEETRVYLMEKSSYRIDKGRVEFRSSFETMLADHRTLWREQGLTKLQ